MKMLSFLQNLDSEWLKRRQGQTKQKPSDNPDVQSDSPDARQERDYLTTAAHRRQVRRSTIMLAVLFGFGLLCLCFMINKSVPHTAAGTTVSDEEKQVGIALQKLTGVSSEMSNRMDDIVEKFYQFSDVHQVQVDELVKNPFEREIFLADSRGNYGAGKSSIAPEVQRQRQLRNRAESMQLLSIMQSGQAGACCMIDDKILYEGDSINGFRVSQIGNNFVKLKAEDFETVLKLSE